MRTLTATATDCYGQSVTLNVWKDPLRNCYYAEAKNGADKGALKKDAGSALRSFCKSRNFDLKKYEWLVKETS